MKNNNIGIIGGGLSGLIAAYNLYRKLGNDINLTIIEKNDRIGGRIFTKNFNSCPMEIGAMFYINGGKIQYLLKSLNLEQSILLDKEKFISIYHNQKLFGIDDFFSSVLTKGEKEEIRELKKYVKNLDFKRSYKSCNFKNWYNRNIGKRLEAFWKRMLMSLGVRDLKSINTHFALTLIYVLISGQNYIYKRGLQCLVKELSKKISSFGGKINTGAKCVSIKKENKKFKLIIQTKDGKEKTIIFDKLISAIKPKDLSEIYDEDNNFIKNINKIDGHPLGVYAIQTDKKLWKKTWGLVIPKEKCPLYILLDWKNITKTKKETPFLAIGSASATKEEIIDNLQTLFPDYNSKFKIIYEKRWSVGLHQPNGDFYDIRNEIIKNLPSNFCLAGDWMVLPSIEGAVISGKRSVKSIIE
ncbi:MAG: FAD-dependent oxidoreductase [Candidatus Thermoplasmatota archaeon]